MVTQDGFTVNAYVAELVERMGGLTGDIRAALDALQDDIKPLKSSWSGEAADAWTRAQDNWNAEYVEMTERFGSAQLALGHVLGNYKAMDRNLSAKF